MDDDPLASDVATAVTVFHPLSEPDLFDRWLSQLLDSARRASGYLGGTGSAYDVPGLDRAMSVTFDTETALHAWLDGTERAELLRDGQIHGHWRATTDLVLVEHHSPPAGVSAFRHSVAQGRVSDFRTAQAGLVEATAKYPGFEGTALFPPSFDDQWTSVMRFRAPGQLGAWLQSPERATLLTGLRSSLDKDFSTVAARTTPFGTTVRSEHGRTLMTPSWKSAMLVLLVLYPTVMLLSRFVGPVLDEYGAEPWLALWLSQVLSISLMQWWLMPLASRRFRRWLDPILGAGWRISLRGAAVVLGCYALTLALFATVQWLQFWDFASR